MWPLPSGINLIYFFTSPIKMCRPTTKYLLLTSHLSELYTKRLSQVVAHHCKVQIILREYYLCSYDVVPLITMFQLHPVSFHRFSGDKVSSKLLVQIVAKNTSCKPEPHALNIVCSWCGKVSWMDGQQSRLLQVQTGMASKQSAVCSYIASLPSTRKHFDWAALHFFLEAKKWFSKK